jgi:2,3,4,5-tetrahydropyridine-2-carboxylate N-succinyltransferase
MSNAQLETAIEAAWDARDTITPATTGETREAIEETLNALDGGTLRVAERQDDGTWHVNQWAKKAVLLGFRLKDMEHAGRIGPQGGSWWDKVDSKWGTWGENRVESRRFPRGAQLRGAQVRLYRARRGPDAVLRQPRRLCRQGTMVDTWATVGSCAQIGKNVHLSGGVGIGGVLEPMQAGPTIIEDNCFIGARSEVVEGVHRPRRLRPGHGRVHRPIHEDRRS